MRKASGLPGLPTPEPSGLQNSLPGVLTAKDSIHSGAQAMVNTDQPPAVDCQQKLPLPSQSVPSAVAQKAHAAAKNPKQAPAAKHTDQQSSQPQQQDARYDCQGLRLLPGDAVLRSERLAADRHGKSGSIGQAEAADAYLGPACAVDAIRKHDSECSVSERPYTADVNTKGCGEGCAKEQGKSCFDLCL